MKNYRHRTHKTGAIYFIYSVPEEVEGYTRDPHNFRTFNPIFPECEHRKIKTKGGCCGDVIIKTCGITGETVDIFICKNCEMRGQNGKSQNTSSS